MNCKEFEQNVDAFLDSEVDVHDVRDIEAHISGCEICAARLNELRRAGGALREQMAVSAPATIDRAVMAAFRQQHGAPVESTGLWGIITGRVSMPRWAFAGLMLFAAVAGVYAYWLGKSGVSQDEFASKESIVDKTTVSDSPNKLTPSDQNETPAQPEDTNVPVIKMVRVPYYKEKVVTRFVIRERMVTKPASNSAKSEDVPEVSIIENDIKASNQPTETDLKGFESVPEIKATIIKKGDEDEKEK